MSVNLYIVMQNNFITQYQFFFLTSTRDTQLKHTNCDSSNSICKLSENNKKCCHTNSEPKVAHSESLFWEMCNKNCGESMSVSAWVKSTWYIKQMEKKPQQCSSAYSKKQSLMSFYSNQHVCCTYISHPTHRNINRLFWHNLSNMTPEVSSQRMMYFVYFEIMYSIYSTYSVFFRT